MTGMGITRAFPFFALSLFCSCTSIFGVEAIKKINSADVEALRLDKSRRVVMEGHGSTLEYLPKVEGSRVIRQHLIYIPKDKDYPEPWLQKRRKSFYPPRTQNNSLFVDDAYDTSISESKMAERPSFEAMSQRHSNRLEDPQE